MAKALFGGGCFWCLDAIFRKVDGVKDVVVGYSGGRRKNPTYEQVCTGTTGHAEVVMIEYDENKISYDELLDIFFSIHDPTQLNRQGNDIGTQYRSVIFYFDEKQKEKSLKKIDELKKSLNVVTEVKPFKEFFKAEEYHQNYFEKNPNNPYCMFVIAPKVSKFLSGNGKKISE